MRDEPAFRRHDHARCRGAALAAAAALCERERLRLTPVRRRALEILLESHRPLGAYALLERLRAEGLGAQPPVAYRALDFLTAHGLAHRIERLNAFVACPRPGETHAPAFLICGPCGRVAEALGFDVARAIVELEGICPACRDGAAGEVAR